MRDTHFSMLPERAFLRVGGRMTYEGGGKGGTTVQAAPDYTGAAVAQGQQAKEIATQTNWANRPTVSTPWGTSSWNAAASTDPSTGQAVTDWTQNVSLSPQQQAALNDQMGIQAGRSDIAQGLLGQVADATSKPFNWDGMPKAPGSVEDAQKNAFQTMSASLQPGRTQQGQDLETRLANMGLAPGTEAYQRQKMALQNQWTQEDKSLLSQSMAEGRSDVATQTGIRQQAIAEEAQRRGMSLNEMNALLTGQQVSMPQGMQTAPNSTAQSYAAPNLLGAAQAQGQYDLGQQQLAQSGGTNWGSALGGIAQAGMMAYMMSDARLKKDLVPLGDGWYEFEYVWGGGRRIGVIAQELMVTRPDLVAVHPSGFLVVNYGGL